MFKKMISKMRNYLLTPAFQELQANSLFGKSSVEQKILTIMYKQLYDARRKPLSFKEVGCRVYSQSEEDGIILFIFSLIGTTNRRCVEICCGDGIECNTANLIVNHGWIGLLCDGKEKNIKKANRFYSKNPNTRLWPPRIVKEWITKDNVNTIFEQNGFAGEIDLLSIDIDGVDYWLWKQVSCVSPRVVVVEFNHLWGPDHSVTVPYRDDFVGEFSQYGSDYAGASLKAFVKLGRDKGYRLVGTNAIATNAFFIRDDIVCDWLGEIKPSSCFDHPRAKFGMAQRLPNIKDKEWVEV